MRVDLLLRCGAVVCQLSLIECFPFHAPVNLFACCCLVSCEDLCCLHTQPEE